MSYYARSYTPADGTNTDFSVAFPYLDRSHVKVFIDGVENTDWSWITDSLIRLLTPPANGSTVLVQRFSSPEARLVDYESPSSLNEEDLDTDSLQAFYLGQEAVDQANSGVTDDSSNGQATAGNRRLTNVADPVDDQDAATKHFVETGVTSQVVAATQQAVQAATSATGAAAALASAQAVKTAVEALVDDAEAAVDLAQDAASDTANDLLAVAAEADAAVSASLTAASAASTATAAKADVVELAATAAAAKLAAEAARDATLSAFANFSEKYLGEFATAPTQDALGNPLGPDDGGLLYYSSEVGNTGMRVWTGTAWFAAYVSGEGVMVGANNLSEITSAAAARANLGLDNVSNTSDLDKPVSTATQTALNGKQDQSADLDAIAELSASNDDLIQRKGGVWTNRTPAQVKTDLGLNNVNNTSDAAKPVSTATQTALNLKLGRVGQPIAVVNAHANQAPSTAYATLGVRAGHIVLDFDAATAETAIFNGIVPANFLGSSLTVRINSAMASATSGTLGWLVAFERLTGQNLNSAGFAADKASALTTVPAVAGEVMQHSITFSLAEADGLSAGDPFRIRLQRNAVSDTATGDAQFLLLIVEEGT